MRNLLVAAAALLIAVGARADGPGRAKGPGERITEFLQQGGALGVSKPLGEVPDTPPGAARHRGLVILASYHNPDQRTLALPRPIVLMDPLTRRSADRIQQAYEGQGFRVLRIDNASPGETARLIGEDREANPQDYGDRSSPSLILHGHGYGVSPDGVRVPPGERQQHSIVSGTILDSFPRELGQDEEVVPPHPTGNPGQRYILYSHHRTGDVIRAAAGALGITPEGGPDLNVVVSSCFSGLALDDLRGSGLEDRIALHTSSRQDEVSWIAGVNPETRREMTEQTLEFLAHVLEDGEAFRAADTDGDGRLAFSEFNRYVSANAGRGTAGYAGVVEAPLPLPTGGLAGLMNMIPVPIQIDSIGPTPTGGRNPRVRGGTVTGLVSGMPAVLAEEEAPQRPQRTGPDHDLLVRPGTAKPGAPPED